MKIYILLFVFLLCSTSLLAQFNIDEYKKYLLNHKDMTVDQLLTEYPAGIFLSEAPTDFLKADYADSISQKYVLTDYEKNLIEKHGFMVSERLSYYTFMQAFWDVYIKDLPVYISSDVILHALHYSYNQILMSFEEYLLIPTLDSALKKMKLNLGTVSIENQPEIFLKVVNDMDIYLTVAQKLLKGKSTCNFAKNEIEVNKLISLINSMEINKYPLFSNTERYIDFSQFTPRGHYTRNSTFTRYFKTMTWLGRTEILFTNPENDQIQKHSDEDLQRMAILTALIAETAMKSGAYKDLNNIDSILTFFIGRQDNISLTEIINVMNALSFTAYDICDKDKWVTFKEKILELSSANQLYNSQILFSDPLDPNKVVPSAAFLLMGQRPVIDGFITANVVYDNILYKGQKVKRMVPSTLDILFSLGNDAVIQLLTDELTKYPYSSNLASLRYLIDSYDNNFWKSSTYTCWLNSIKSLNPPKQRENLPKFMQTAAWWQKTMNTQLASWSELRHDFLLYGKQPYTSSFACSYPSGYVEAVPEFYENSNSFFESLNDLLNSDLCKSFPKRSDVSGFANFWINVNDTLKSMAIKIIQGREFSNEENLFLTTMLFDGQLCDPYGPRPKLGWYSKLYYGFLFDEFKMYSTQMDERGTEADDFIVADVHTIPTDEYGNMVGWVLHGGTGRINMAVVTAPTPNGGSRAYIGPVSSYYEFISNDFKRLSDEDWREMDGVPAYRPAFTNLYLANKQGNKPNGDKISLFTIGTSVSNETKKEVLTMNLNCFPNPFSNSTVICFTLNKDMDLQFVELNIYDLEGNLIKSLIKQKLYKNNYSIVWDGTDDLNNKVSGSTYIYSIKIGEQIQSGKIKLIK